SNGARPAEAPSVAAALAHAQAAVEGRGRAFLRPSGTEPVVRVTVAADDEALMQQTVETLAAAVREAAEAAWPEYEDDMSQTRIPTLDLRRFTDPSSQIDRKAFVAELGNAYREWGFAGIRGHGISQEQIAGCYDVFRRFFALPEVVKRKY